MSGWYEKMLIPLFKEVSRYEPNTYYLIIQGYLEPRGKGSRGGGWGGSGAVHGRGDSTHWTPTTGNHTLRSGVHRCRRPSRLASVPLLQQLFGPSTGGGVWARWGLQCGERPVGVGRHDSRPLPPFQIEKQKH